MKVSKHTVTYQCLQHSIQILRSVILGRINQICKKKMQSKKVLLLCGANDSVLIQSAIEAHDKISHYADRPGCHQMYDNPNCVVCKQTLCSQSWLTLELMQLHLTVWQTVLPNQEQEW